MRSKIPATPMMQQYFKVKEEYTDCILFFRLGDFYEMFFDDAILASEVLEITLTGKDCGQEERAPMCGIPYHSVEGYIAKLVKKGYKIAICEQVEDPKSAKGIVKRDVIRVITPGTANIESALPSTENNFLACIYADDKYYGVSFADVSTGEVFTTEGTNDIVENSLLNTLACFQPAEILINDKASPYAKQIMSLKNKFEFFDSFLPETEFDYDDCTEQIKRQFKVQSLDRLNLMGKKYCIRSLGTILRYLNETQKTDLSHISTVKFYQSGEYMEIDVNSRRNLELTETLREKAKRGSLLGVLDKTKTAMGARRLKSWIDRPLVNAKQIRYRSEAVEELTQNVQIREDITEDLKKVNDIERILSKVVYGTCNARDMVSLRQSLQQLPSIQRDLSQCQAPFLKTIYEQLDVCADIALLIENAIVDEPPLIIREGGMIRKGFDKELDKVRDIMNNGTGYIAKIEAEEKEKTGIKNLKIAYNKVFGYYIEVSNSQRDKVPETYIRKQTLVNGERYITQELKEIENTILGAREKVNTIEYEDFVQIKNDVYKNIARLQSAAKLISVTDVLCSFANVAVSAGYICPEVDDGNGIDIRNGRHPIVERTLSDALFVPNDTQLDTESNRFAIITGPNMAGKSTYMRQTALIVLMAQIGSFVPADACHIGIVDKIFTRVGASDDLASGQSTFMVEMNEVANILKNATPKSLIILDEIGRGTSTFDGLSIAWAVSEYICDKNKIGAKTLFATHYHELIRLEDTEDGVVNYSVAVKKRGDDITFLRKIVRGGTDDSFGIEVAFLAGVPETVVRRAKEVLQSIEEGSPKQELNIKEKSDLTFPQQSDAEKKATAEVAEELKQTDLSTLTPIEALNLLYTMQKKLL